MADRDLDAEAIDHMFTSWAQDDAKQWAALRDSFTLKLMPVDLPQRAPAQGGGVAATEQSGTEIVDGAEDDGTMTDAFTKADWRRLGIAGLGSVAIGAGAMLSPLVPIGAIALGAIAVTVTGLRSARH